jgi:hypothetical protein
MSTLILPTGCCYATHDEFGVLQANVFPREYFSVSELLQNGQCQMAGRRVKSPEEHLSMYHNMDLGYLFFDMKHLPSPDRVCFADIRMDKSIGNWPWHTRGCLFLYLSMIMTSDHTGERRKASALTEEQVDAIKASLRDYAALQDGKDQNVQSFAHVIKSYAAYRWANTYICV